VVLMSDEVRRTQRGNNNSYCQDNETSWYDCDLTTAAADLLRFVQGFLEYRKGLSLFTDERFWGEPGSATVAWHGVELGQPDFGDDSHTLALELSQPGSEEHLHIIFNAYWGPLDFPLPGLPEGRQWHRLVDTSLASPEDFCNPAQPLGTGQLQDTVPRRTTVILIG
jgi:isoamylase